MVPKRVFCRENTRGYLQIVLLSGLSNQYLKIL